MSNNITELLLEVKSQYDEVDPSEVNQLSATRASTPGSTCAKTDEVAAGHLPGAKHIPRRILESRIEGVVPDRDAHVILYCASGNRSAYGAPELAEDLGYTNVSSMKGEITLWKDRGCSRSRSPAHAHPEQRERYRTTR